MKPIRIIRLFITGISLLIVLLTAACAPASNQKLSIQYYSPLKDAEYVSTGATIAVRYGISLTKDKVSDLKFNVTGSQSGVHNGQTVLADDSKTVIFKPDSRFLPGETVKVALNSLRLSWITAYPPLSYSFTVAQNQKPGGVGATPAPPPDQKPNAAFPNDLTVPQDIPHYTVSVSNSNNSDGYVFVAPFYWTRSTIGSYLLILNTQGKLIYYQNEGDALSAFDFKPQPNGLISYFDQKRATFFVMDSHYEVVNSYQAGNGYTTDLHDLQILPNGNALLMAYDAETMDMSTVAPGGKKNAQVTGLIIQELDPSKNVIFEWRSWDHFKVTDTNQLLTDPQIDPVHGNALALANDGNLLLSSRNQSEITKINLQTGEVMWRLGGKANQFKFIGGQPFAFQHDIRQLPNGDITIFDNQGDAPSSTAPSHAIEYRLDEKNLTATVVWSYTHNPPVFGTFMGNQERLPGGNIFISWGAPSQAKGYAWENMTELDSKGKTIFEMAFDAPYVSYRAFMAPWQGAPNTDPTLAFKASSSGILLGYSWNGATNVASYVVFGGSQPLSLKQVDKQTAVDFETQTTLNNIPAAECYFQVAALDSHGNEVGRSKVISTDNTKCPLGY